MENASRALIMAAGVLIAIMILAVGILVFNKMSDFSQGEVKVQEEEQLSTFNAQYEAFNRTDLTGFDMVSIMNKIIDYNDRNGDNPDKNYTKMDFSFNLKKTDQLFDVRKYDTEQSGKIESIMKKMQELEKSYTANTLTKLIAKMNAEEQIGSQPGTEELKKYESYIEFKRKKFECTGTEYDKNTGRIIKMNFQET